MALNLGLTPPTGKVRPENLGRNPSARATRFYLTSIFFSSQSLHNATSNAKAQSERRREQRFRSWAQETRAFSRLRKLEEAVENHGASQVTASGAAALRETARTRLLGIETCGGANTRRGEMAIEAGRAKQGGEFTARSAWPSNGMEAGAVQRAPRIEKSFNF